MVEQEPQNPTIPMNRMLKLVAPLLALITVGALPAVSQEKSALPVLSIQQVDAADSTTYAMWMARNNEVAKAKLGIDKYFRVFIGEAAGDASGVVSTTVLADSFVTLTKNWRTILADPVAAENRASMSGIRKLGPQTLLKAVRFEGRNEGAWLLNTQMNVSDEAGYLKSLDEFRALFDKHGFKDTKINAYRVVAGRTDHTHLVSVNSPSEERRAALMDAIQTEASFAEWLAAAAKFRAVVRNGTYREITR